MTISYEGWNLSFALLKESQDNSALTVSVMYGRSSVLRPTPRQHSIGYMGDGLYRSKDPTNSVEVLKEHMCLSVLFGCQSAVSIAQLPCHQQFIVVAFGR